MKSDEIFELKEEHLKLLSAMWVVWENDYDGAPAIDIKRPYGNSSVYEDVFELLGYEFDRDEGLTNDQIEQATAIHRETETAPVS